MPRYVTSEIRGYHNYYAWNGRTPHRYTATAGYCFHTKSVRHHGMRQMPSTKSQLTKPINGRMHWYGQAHSMNCIKTPTASDAVKCQPAKAAENTWFSLDLQDDKQIPRSCPGQLYHQSAVDASEDGGVQCVAD